MPGAFNRECSGKDKTFLPSGLFPSLLAGFFFILPPAMLLVKQKVCWSELLLKRKGDLHSTKIVWPCGESSIRPQKQVMKDAALAFFGLKSHGEQPSFWDLLGELASIRFVCIIELHKFFCTYMSKRLINRWEVSII